MAFVLPSATNMSRYNTMRVRAFTKSSAASSNDVSKNVKSDRISETNGSGGSHGGDEDADAVATSEALSTIALTLYCGLKISSG